MLHILVPARNEGGRIEAVLRAVHEVTGAPVVVVDGHSTDDTAERARRLGAEVVRQEGEGYASALRTGYRALVARGATRCVQLDADGQHPASELPRLVQALDRADIVTASRHATASGGPLSRRAGNALLAGLVLLRTGVRVRDVTSGFWATNARAMEVLARGLDQGVADANVRVLMLRSGLVLREVPVLMAERQGGESMHDGAEGLKNLGRSVRALWA